MATRKKSTTEAVVEALDSVADASSVPADYALVPVGDHELADDGTGEQLSLFEPEASNGLRLKDDNASMEFPFFTLSKKPDKKIREIRFGDKYIKVIPSVIGAANQFDKDIVIYAISQIIKAQSAGQPHSRRMRFAVGPFLLVTKRSTGGESYERFVEACNRLRGTVIQTNIKTQEQESTRGFGLIDEYEITQGTKNGKGALEVEIVISDWYYRAATKFEVLTIPDDYFSLGKPLERKLYELARKHCGDKAYFVMDLDLTRRKCGSEQVISEFLREVKAIILDDHLPEYSLAYDKPSKKLVFLSRDQAKLHQKLLKDKRIEWFYALLRKESLESKPKRQRAPAKKIAAG